MDNCRIRYYILFENYEQGLALHLMLDSYNLPNRIAPAPRCGQEKLSCGMALLIEEDNIDKVRRCILENNGEYHDIISLTNQIQPLRDKYC